MCAQSRVNKWGGGRGGTPGQSIISSDFKGGYRSQILSKTGGFADQTDADSASRVSLAPSPMRVTTPRGDLNIYAHTHWQMGGREGKRNRRDSNSANALCVSIIYARCISYQRRPSQPHFWRQTQREECGLAQPEIRMGVREILHSHPKAPLNLPNWKLLN